MPRAEWTPRAEQELENIAYYIGVENRRPKTAAQLVREIIAKCETYAQSPEIGTVANELGEGCRIISHKRWIITYLPVDFGIQVIGIVDAARDYPSWKR